MKNIHVLPTDNYAPLVHSTNKYGGYFKSEHYSPMKEMGDSYQHIYITSDEEIKEGDWIFNEEREPSVLQCIGQGSLRGWNKIILTTDQDLIKDGVQAIDDEFLEWFVKNPSCEKVEVKRNKKLSNKSIWDAVEGDLVFNNHNCGGVITQLSNDIRVHIISENGEGYMETAITSDNGLDTLVINNYKVYEYSDYKIIIPKEELEQETVEEREPYWELVDKKAEKNNTIDLDAYANGIRDGAKWQAERMYSEEDLKRAFEAGHKKGFSGYPNTENWKELPFEKWFEQIKKK